MYLKALEIQGFKSFAEKTVLTFEKDITAIVGPNGSGKSNISDALLWVMGEQRSKALRGGKMEDVIFGGTEKRSPMGFAQVSLMLDNSGGLFAIDTPEVVITRRYYRNGESEYYINREAVRLRDVTELLMDTGLGRDGYSVIGQGRIAEIVSAKSSDRREIFEEAAGIARYRARKEEAERKLQRTDENLLRINDKIDELEMQVLPLQQQAETAKKFLILRDEQRTLEISVWVETLDRLHEQSESINADYEGAKQTLEKAQNELQDMYKASEDYAEKMRECDVEAEGLRSQQSAGEGAAAECESAIAVLTTSLTHNNENIERVRAEMSEQTARAKSLEEQIESQRRRVSEIEAEKVETELKIRAASRETEENADGTGEAQRGLAELVSKENAANDALTQSQTMLSMLDDRKRELSERGESIDADIAGAEEKYKGISAQLHQAQKEQSEAKQRLDEINNIISGHRMLMSGRESKVSELTDRLGRLTVDKRSAEGRINMLSEMEKEFEGLGKAVKTVMRDASRGSLRGIHGPVASLISVDDRFAVAIETALGGAMQNIVVDTQEAGKAAIEMLKRSDSGRATFLPISTIRPNGLKRAPVGEEGYLGVASDIVRYDPRYENIFTNLLGRTVIAETLGDAVRISKKFDNQLRIVSLDGQLINAGGSMTGGSAGRNVGILSRANELKKLREQHEKLVSAEKACAEALDEARRELEGSKYELQVATNELAQASEELHRADGAVSQCKLLQSAIDENLDSLDAEKTGLSSRRREIDERMEKCRADSASCQAELLELKAKISEISAGCEEFEKRRSELAAVLSTLREAFASLDAERDATLRSIDSLSGLLATISGDSEQRLRSIAEIEARNGDIKAEIGQKTKRAAEIRGNVEGFKQRIAELVRLRLELEGKRTQSERSGQDKNRELLDMQSICARYEQKKLSAEMEEKQIVDKLWDSYELSRSAANELRQPVENMATANKRVTELRREITKLGPVNVGAIDEYERVSERYNFLKEQRDDVDKAKRELEKIIADVTGEMKDIFTREFHAIDDEFRRVFLELFGGGKAALELEDEENVLECGIDIKVQPPGKAVTTISLLSGGEKSFVAIALYFAIMKVRPSPFCIMDEIDAALDEANVSKYASYMRGITEKTQFIVITHHRATMEEADMLYGVTMQEKGVTTVLSVDLEEAERSIS